MQISELATRGNLRPALDLNIEYRPTGVGRQVITVRRGPKTGDESAAMDARARDAVARYSQTAGAITLGQAAAMQRAMCCAACGGKLIVEQDTDLMGRLMCLLCARTVKDVRFDIPCQKRQN